MVALRPMLGPILKSAQDDFDAWAQANAPWMKEAYGQLGVREIAGRGQRNSNERINGFLLSCCHTAARYPDINLKDDSTPWCSAFVN